MKKKHKILVHVQPRAKESKIIGIINGRLKVKIKAQPNKGNANKELIELLADSLNTALSNITIISGSKSRFKTVSISNIETEKLEHLFESISKT